MLRERLKGRCIQGCELHGLPIPPGTASGNHVGPLQPNVRFGQRVVVGIPDPTHRWFQSCVLQPLGITDGQILALIQDWWRIGPRGHMAL